MQAHIDDSALESSWVVIHIVAPKTEEAHEDQHKVAMQPSTWIAG